MAAHDARPARDARPTAHAWRRRAATAWRADSRRATSLLAIAVALGLAWGSPTRSAGGSAAAARTSAARSSHFVYEALLPMLLLRARSRLADAVDARRRAIRAIAPYAIAAVIAAIGGEILFIATRTVLGLDDLRVQHGPAGRRRRASPTCCPTACSSAASSRPATGIGGARSQRAARALHARELERAQLDAADAGIAAAGDAGVHRAAVPVRHAGATSSACTRATPNGAARLLDDLIVYLRAALPHLRESTSTRREGVRARDRVPQHPAPAPQRPPAFHIDRRRRRARRAHAADAAAAARRLRARPTRGRDDDDRLADDRASTSTGARLRARASAACRRRPRSRGRRRRAPASRRIRERLRGDSTATRRD